MTQNADNESTPRPLPSRLPPSDEDCDATPKAETQSLPCADESEVSTLTPTTQPLPHAEDHGAAHEVPAPPPALPAFNDAALPCPLTPSWGPMFSEAVEDMEELLLPPPAMTPNWTLPPVSLCSCHSH